MKIEVIMSIVGVLNTIIIFIISIYVNSKNERERREKKLILDAIEKLNEKIESINTSLHEISIKINTNDLNNTNLAVYLSRLDSDFKEVQKVQWSCRNCQENR